MGTLFYFQVILFIVFEGFCLIYSEKISEIGKRDTKIMDEDRRNLHYAFNFFMLATSIAYLIIDIIGIIKTPQRVWFGVIFLMAIVKLILTPLLKKSKAFRAIYYGFDHSVSMAILGYIIYLQYFLSCPTY